MATFFGITSAFLVASLFCLGHVHGLSCPTGVNVAQMCAVGQYSGPRVLIDMSTFSNNATNCSCIYTTTGSVLRIATYTAPNYPQCNSAIRLYSTSGNNMRFQCLLSGTYLDTSVHKQGMAIFETYGETYDNNYCLMLEQAGSLDDIVTVQCTGSATPASIHPQTSTTSFQTTTYVPTSSITTSFSSSKVPTSSAFFIPTTNPTFTTSKTTENDISTSATDSTRMAESTTLPSAVPTTRNMNDTRDVTAFYNTTTPTWDLNSTSQASHLSASAFQSTQPGTMLINDTNFGPIEDTPANFDITMRTSTSHDNNTMETTTETTTVLSEIVLVTEVVTGTILLHGKNTNATTRFQNIDVLSSNNDPADTNTTTSLNNVIPADNAAAALASESYKPNATATLIETAETNTSDVHVPDTVILTGPPQTIQTNETISMSSPADPSISNETISMSSPADPSISNETISMSSPADPNISNETISMSSPADPNISIETISMSSPADPNISNETISMSSPADPNISNDTISFQPFATLFEDKVVTVNSSKTTASVINAPHERITYGMDSINPPKEEVTHMTDSLHLPTERVTYGMDFVDPPTESVTYGMDSITLLTEWFQNETDSLNQPKEEATNKTDSLHLPTERIPYGMDFVNPPTERVTYGMDSISKGVPTEETWSAIKTEQSLTEQTNDSNTSGAKDIWQTIPPVVLSTVLPTAIVDNTAQATEPATAKNQTIAVSHDTSDVGKLFPTTIIAPAIVTSETQNSFADITMLTTASSGDVSVGLKERRGNTTVSTKPTENTPFDVLLTSFSQLPGNLVVDTISIQTQQSTTNVPLYTENVNVVYGEFTPTETIPMMKDMSLQNETKIKTEINTNVSPLSATVPTQTQKQSTSDILTVQEEFGQNTEHPVLESAPTTETLPVQPINIPSLKHSDTAQTGNVTSHPVSESAPITKRTPVQTTNIPSLKHGDTTHIVDAADDTVTATTYIPTLTSTETIHTVNLTSQQNTANAAMNTREPPATAQVLTQTQPQSISDLPIMNEELVHNIDIHVLESGYTTEVIPDPFPTTKDISTLPTTRLGLLEITTVDATQKTLILDSVATPKVMPTLTSTELPDTTTADIAQEYSSVSMPKTKIIQSVSTTNLPEIIPKGIIHFEKSSVVEPIPTSNEFSTTSQTLIDLPEIIPGDMIEMKKVSVLDAIPPTVPIATTERDMPDIIPGDSVQKQNTRIPELITPTKDTPTTKKAYDVLMVEELELTEKPVSHNGSSNETGSNNVGDNINVSFGHDMRASFFYMNNNTYIIVVASIAGLVVLAAVLGIVIHHSRKHRSDKADISSHVTDPVNHKNLAYDSNDAEQGNGNIEGNGAAPIQENGHTQSVHYNGSIEA